MTNAGNWPLSRSPHWRLGINSVDFPLPKLPNPLAAGASCTLTVYFKHRSPRMSASPVVITDVTDSVHNLDGDRNIFRHTRSFLGPTSLNMGSEGRE